MLAKTTLRNGKSKLISFTVTLLRVNLDNALKRGRDGAGNKKKHLAK